VYIGRIRSSLAQPRMNVYLKNWNWESWRITESDWKFYQNKNISLNSDWGFLKEEESWNQDFLCRHQNLPCTICTWLGNESGRVEKLGCWDQSGGSLES
jgi:hypothetical protein